MDDVTKVQSLTNNMAGWIDNEADRREQTSEVACSLIVSSFYFERDGRAVQNQAQASPSIELRGRIRCRIGARVAEVKALGVFLASCHIPAAFVIEDPTGKDDDQRIKIPMNELREDGRCEDVPVAINIPSEDTRTTIALDMHGIVE
jgi:hypothetical protein